MSNPTTLKEFFDFYYQFAKPLYCAVQLTNQLPVETLFEIHAALDHISRQWAYGETEAQVVGRASAHLKRSCFDIFKLRVKQAVDHFEELRGFDTAVIDNGEFDRKLVALIHRIRQGAIKAREGEGNTKDDHDLSLYAFGLWEPVFQDCVALDKEFYQHPRIDWAKKRYGRGKWAERGLGFLSGVVASLIAAAICALAAGWFSSGRSVGPARSGNPPLASPAQ